VSSTFPFQACLVALALVGAACRRPGSPPSSGAREVTQEGSDRFRAFALEPARRPPPSLDPLATASARGLTGQAEVVHVEQASWNLGPDGAPVLFNDRWVWLLQVDIASSEGKPISWVAQQATLELNDPETVLHAAPLPDDILGDLLFWALQEERAGVPGDLVARTRAAGGFRTRYLSRTSSSGVLSGLVAFPAADVEGLHVVAARLNIPVVHDGATVPMVWVFD